MSKLLAVFFLVSITCNVFANDELCTHPKPVHSYVKPEQLVGTWYFQRTNGSEKEWKSCEFNSNGKYSCKVNEQGSIDKSGKLLEVHSYIEDGRWILIKNRLTKESMFNIVNYSSHAFKIENENGYFEIYFKNKACVSTL